MFFFKLFLMLLVSGTIFYIAYETKETTSWWVARLRKMSARIQNVHPFVLAVSFLIFIFALLGLILFLMKMAPWVVKGIYVFSTANIAFVVSSLWLDHKFNQVRYWTWVKIVLSLSVGLSWIIFPEWYVYNAVGLICAVGFLQLFPSLNFRHMFALGLAIVAYDIVGVYMTGWIIQLASSFSFVPPAVMYIPAVVEAASSANMSMIGLGDIIIGGIMLSSARRYATEKTAFLGYSIGVAASLTLAVITNYGVPATMFIIPAMLFFIWLGARKQNFHLA